MSKFYTLSLVLFLMTCTSNLMAESNAKPIQVRRKLTSLNKTKVIRSLPKKDFLLSAGPSIHTGGFGLGLGLEATLALKNKVIDNPLELGISFSYLPSIASSSSASYETSSRAFNISGTAKTILSGNRLNGFGMEAGLAYMSISVSSKVTDAGAASFGSQFAASPFSAGITEASSVSGSTFGPLLGAVGRYEIGSGLHLQGTSRLLILNSTLFQLNAGIGAEF